MKLTRDNIAKMERRFTGISQVEAEDMVYKWMEKEDYSRLHVVYWALDGFVAGISLREEVYRFLRNNDVAPEGKTNAEYRGL